MEELVLNLLFVIKDGKILLGKKKRGFGMGVLTGCGGKVEEGETVEQAMLRESKEEVGIVPKNLTKVAINVFNIIHNDVRKLMIVHVFVANDYDGQVSESCEFAPIWFDLHSIPFEEMWQDDVYWLPKVLEGHKVKTYFYFDEAHKLTEHSVKVVQSLDEAKSNCFECGGK